MLLFYLFLSQLPRGHFIGNGTCMILLQQQQFIHQILGFAYSSSYLGIVLGSLQMTKKNLFYDVAKHPVTALG